MLSRIAGIWTSQTQNMLHTLSMVKSDTKMMAVIKTKQKLFFMAAPKNIIFVFDIMEHFLKNASESNFHAFKP